MKNLQCNDWRNGSFALLLGVLLTLSARAQGPDPLRWHVDEQLYRQAYGVLASEHLLYPIDQKDWPVKIDQTRQLFLDDYLLASIENIRRKVNPAKKHAANPLIDRDRPWEGFGPTFHTVLRDEKTGKFRMWYSAYHNYVLPSGVTVRSPMCYAESNDGITWHKPDIGLYEYDGSKANNIVIPKGAAYAIFDEPPDREPDRRRRFKAIVWHDWTDPQGAPPEGYYLYTSHDGIHWTQARQRPLALNQNRHQPGIGDTSLFFWDPRLERYVSYTKILFRNPTMRSSGMMESDDLIHWSRPRMTIYPDGLDDQDTQIYAHCGFVHESMWMGLVRVMHTDLIEASRKQTVVQLTASRDGRHWTRVGQREVLIPLGAADEWDPHYHAPTSKPMLVGDEHWIYYFSMPLWDPQVVGEDVAMEKKIARIGLAKLRRDGFVSLDAGDETGRVVTRPLTFEGSQLFVNVKVGPGGYLKAAFADLAGKPLGGYDTLACKPVTGDRLSAPIAWMSQERIECTNDESLRLIFELKNAKLYSFWIE